MLLPPEDRVGQVVGRCMSRPCPLPATFLPVFFSIFVFLPFRLQPACSFLHVCRFASMLLSYPLPMPPAMPGFHCPSFHAERGWELRNMSCHLCSNAKAPRQCRTDACCFCKKKNRGMPMPSSSEIFSREDEMPMPRPAKVPSCSS